MFSGSKFQRCGPVIEKEFLANEAHLNFGNLRRSVLFDLKSYIVCCFEVTGFKTKSAQGSHSLSSVLVCIL